MNTIFKRFLLKNVIVLFFILSPFFQFAQVQIQSFLSQPDPATVCEEDEIIFTTNASGMGLEYIIEDSVALGSWNFVSSSMGNQYTFTSNIGLHDQHYFRVIVTDGVESDTSENEILVSVNNNPTVTIFPPTTTELICSVEGIDLIANSPSANVNYLWSNNSTSPTISINAPGWYYVTVTENFMCTSVDSIEITENITLPIPVVESTTGSTEIDCLTSSINLSGVNSSPSNVIYSWSTGENTSNIDVTTAGTYTLTVTDPSNNCSDAISFLVTENITLPTSVVESTTGSTEINCLIGSINLTGMSSTPSDVIYSWSTGENTSNIDVTTAGTYTLTVTDPSNNCSDATSFIITENIVLPIPVVESTTGLTEINCLTTSINLTGMNSTPIEVIYSWSTGENTSNIDVTTAGTYTLTVIDPSNNCSDATSFLVTENITLPTPVVESTTGSTEINCLTSSINLTGMNSTPNDVIYSWSTGENTSNIDVTTAGTYTLTVTDPSNNCSDTTSFTITANASDPTAEIFSTNTTLNCETSSITLDATNSSGSGNNSFSFEWSTNETTSTIDVTMSGTYTLTVTDDVNQCTAIENIIIDQNVDTPTANISNSQSVLNCNTSSILLSGLNSNSNGEISYEWNTNETTPLITVTSAGTYTLTVTDQTSLCMDTIDVVIGEDFNDPIAMITPSSTELNCNVSIITLDGSMSIGQMGLTYNWSNGESSSSIDIVTAGTYTLTITNIANGCTHEASQMISENTNFPAANSTANGSMNSINICEGDDLNLASNASGGTGTLSYEWSGPNDYSSTSSSPILSSITTSQSGDYNVQVTDVNGCTVTSSVTVNITPLPNAIIDGGGSICEGEGTDLIITGNPNATVTYSYNGQDFQISLNSSGQNTIPVMPMMTTTYSLSNIVLTTFPACQNNSLTDSETIIVNSLPTANITLPNNDNEFCELEPIELNSSAMGGNNSSYTFNWTDPNGNMTNGNQLTFSSATLAMNGNYQLMVTDGNGCNNNTSTNIIVNPLPTTPIIQGGNAVCEGQTIQLTTMAMGTIDWTTNNTISVSLNEDGNNVDVEGLLFGNSNINYIVTDNNGCVNTSGNLAFTVNDLPEPGIVDEEVSSNSNNDGIVCDGDPVTLIATNCTNCNFIWSNGATGSTQTVIPTIANSTYSVTATDGNGCVGGGISDNLEVLPNPNALIDYNGFNPVVLGGVKFFDISQSMNPIHTWSWTFGNGAMPPNISTMNPMDSFQIQYTTPGFKDIELTTIDENNCSDIETMQIFIGDNLNCQVEITEPNNNDEFCIDQEIPLSVFYQTNGNPLLTTWTWTFGGTLGTDFNVIDSDGPSPKVTYLNSGTFTITVIAKDNSNCSDTSFINVIINSLPPSDITITTPTTDLCSGESVFLEVNNLPFGNSYNLDLQGEGFSNAAIQNLTAQNNLIEVTPPSGNNSYLLMGITDSSTGCFSSLNSSTSINVNALPNITPTNPLCNANNTAYDLTLSVSSGVSPYMVFQNGISQGTFNTDNILIQNLLTGNDYDFYIVDKDGNGCTSNLLENYEHNCDCGNPMDDPGEMINSVVKICEGEMIVIPSQPILFNIDDVNTDTFSYILFNQSLYDLLSISPNGNIFQLLNHSGLLESNSSLTFSSNSLDASQDYYASLVIGNKIMGVGGIDFGDNCAQIAWPPTEIDILERPIVDNYSVNPTIVCPGEEMTISLNLSSGEGEFYNIHYTYNGVSGVEPAVDSSDVSFMISTAEGTMNLIIDSVTYISPPFCVDPNPVLIEIPVHIPPSVDTITWSPDPIQINTPITFMADIIGNGDYSYNWQFVQGVSGLAPSTEAEPERTITEDDPITITLNVTDNITGCTVEYIQIIQVGKVDCLPLIDLEINSNSFCVGDSIHLTNETILPGADASFDTVFWQINSQPLTGIVNGNNTTAEIPPFIGIATLTLTINSEICQDIVSKDTTITILSTPKIETIEDSNTACLNQQVTYLANMDIVNADATTYYWFVNSKVDSTTSPFVNIQWQEEGDFQLVLNAVDVSGCSDEAIENISVTNNNTAPEYFDMVEIERDGDVMLIYPDSTLCYEWHAAIDATDLSQNFSNPDNTKLEIPNDLQYYIFSPDDDIKLNEYDYVWVEIFGDGSSCETGSDCTSKVYYWKGETIPTIIYPLINPNQDEESDFSVLLYPNPNDGLFKIELDGVEKDAKYNFSIFDSQGQLIQQFDKNQDTTGKLEFFMDFNNSRVGLYFLKISGKNGQEIITKFIVHP